MKKKTIAIIIALVLIFTSIPLVAAAGTPTISVSSATAAPGESVTLKVSIANNPGINTFSLGFNYDTTRLSLTNVSLCSGIGGQFQYTKKAVWLNSSDISYNGEYLILSMKVIDNAAPGDARVAVTYNTGDISNYNEDDVDFTLVAGKVTVQQASAQTGIITVGTVNATPNSEITVPVSISNNPGINTFSLGFDYDSTRLSLKSVTLNSKLGGQFTYSRKAVWLNSSDTTYNGEILLLTFDVLTNAPVGDAYVTVTYSAGDISNYNEEDVSFNVVPGKVSVSNNATTTIYAESISRIAPGKNFTLPIKIKGNEGLAYLKIKVAYDRNQFALSQVNNTGLIEGSFVKSKTIDVNPYVMTWTGTENSSNNGAIVNLTFQVLDSAETGSYPITITVSEAYDENFNDVSISTDNPIVTVNPVIIGDVNDDGEINGKDAILLAQYLAEWDVTIDETAADTNDDGTINGKDAILLAQYLAEWDVVLG